MFSKDFKYEFKLFMFRFCMLGVAGLLLELTVMDGFQIIGAVLSHGLPGLVGIDLYRASIMGVFVYCWGAIPLTIMKDYVRILAPHNTDSTLQRIVNSVYRGIIYGVVFMMIELLCGLICVNLFNVWAWDYRHLPLNIMGLTTFIFLPVFAIYGLIGEWYDDFLRRRDDMIIDPDKFEEKK